MVCCSCKCHKKYTLRHRFYSQKDMETLLEKVKRFTKRDLPAKMVISETSTSNEKCSLDVEELTTDEQFTSQDLQVKPAISELSTSTDKCNAIVKKSPPVILPLRSFEKEVVVEENLGSRIHPLTNARKDNVILEGCAQMETPAEGTSLVLDEPAPNNRITSETPVEDLSLVVDETEREPSMDLDKSAPRNKVTSEMPVKAASLVLDEFALHNKVTLENPVQNTVLVLDEFALDNQATSETPVEDTSLVLDEFALQATSEMPVEDTSLVLDEIALHNQVRFSVPVEASGASIESKCRYTASV